MAEARLRFDDIEVGDEAESITHRLTRTDLVTYAGASGDFNPMHHDEVAAQEVGLPSVFGHGMLSMGLLGEAITTYVGIGNLVNYQVRFTKQTWPGEKLTTRVVVAAKRVEDDGRFVDLDVSLVNADGEVKVDGRAIATVD